MWGKLIKITLTLAVTLQLSGVVKASDSHSFKLQSASVSASELPDMTGLAAQDSSSQDTNGDSSSSGHHHCKSHPTGSCCAYLSSSEIKLVPNSKDHAYGIKPNFFFFELVSSNLRPPAITA